MKVKHVIERVMNTVFFICGMVSIAAVLLITIYMVIAGLPAILEIGPIDFLLGQVWQSTAADPKFGILPFIMTSVWGTLGAVVIGVPIGLCTAIFLSKLAPPKLAAIVHPAVELLAGIPSVVYGRAIGEAMAVMMVAGNVANMPGLFKSVRFLTTAVASEMSYAADGSLQKQALFSIGLILFIFIMLINLLLGRILKKGAATK